MYTDSLHFVDYLVIVLSLGVSLYVGAYFAKKQTSTNNYYAGGRSIPSWAVGMSILATLISSITFLAYPGEGFKSNWILLVQGIMVVVVLLGLVWFVVPLYRKVIGISAYEYFEKRFGFFARMYSSIAFALTHFSKMGTVFFLMGLALTSMMGVNVYLIIWTIGIVVIYITLKGGIEAVIWLDVIQGFMLIAGGLLCLGVILFSVEGGPAAIINYALDNDKISFAPYTWDFTKLTFIVMVFNGIFYGIQKYGTDQTIVQRYLTAKSEKGAVRAALMGVVLSLPVWALFMFIGTALFAYYNITVASLPAGIKPDEVFPYFIMTELPIGLTGLILAALLAAAISSLDSDLNCLSAIAVEDYYVRYKKNATDEQKLKFGKLTVILSGIGALLIATLYVILGGEGVLGIVFGLYAIFSGGIAGIFLLGIFSKRANKQGLNIGIGVSILFTAYAVLTSQKFGGSTLLDLGSWNFTHHKYMLGVYSHLIVLIVGYGASFFFKSDVPHDDLTFYAWFKEKRNKKNNGQM
ncbi:MAG: sodium transporter [Ignavibacteria bacterium RBG_13_36_8]|nr:MAG: sodium transporter [Ignavibacteria bacterium RBG_13_36_8]